MGVALYGPRQTAEGDIPAACTTATQEQGCRATSPRAARRRPPCPNRGFAVFCIARVLVHVCEVANCSAHKRVPRTASHPFRRLNYISNEYTVQGCVTEPCEQVGLAKPPVFPSFPSSRPSGPPPVRRTCHSTLRRITPVWRSAPQSYVCSQAINVVLLR
jgi:hypothetical protein